MSATVEHAGGHLERANGSGPHDQDAGLPVDSYREAAPFLRRPFTPQAVKFKVQAAWPKEQPTKGLIVSYIDARLVVERLNKVCPHLWEPRPRFEHGHLWCDLTIDGLTRPDLGEGYQGKGLWSDALKRAAVQFGVGVSLYAVPKIVLTVSDGHVNSERTRNGLTLELTPGGEARCRELYAAWLSTVGVKAFGDPLDHGDVEESIGDADLAAIGTVEANTAAKDTDQPEPQAAKPADEQLTGLLARRGQLQAKRRQADEGMRALGAGPEQRLRELLNANTSEKLDQLITRVGNALDGTGS